jgi:hypothetical protein
MFSSHIGFDPDDDEECEDDEVLPAGVELGESDEIDIAM